MAMVSVYYSYAFLTDQFWILQGYIKFPAPFSSLTCCIYLFLNLCPTFGVCLIARFNGKRATIMTKSHFKRAGLFANRINRSVECGVKLRQNHATPHCMCVLQTEHRNTSQHHGVIYRHVQKGKIIHFNRVGCCITASSASRHNETTTHLCNLWRNDHRLHHEGQGRHVASHPFSFTYS